MKIAFIGTSSRYSIEFLKEIADRYKVVCIIESAPRNYRKSFYNLYIQKKSALKRFAETHNIQYFFCKTISSDYMVSNLKNLQCNLICIASCTQLIKKNIIQIPKYGVINAHGAMLPQYRGANPLFWIFFNGEKTSGITIHYVDEGEDTGDIIKQKQFNIRFGMTNQDYENEVLKYGPQMMVEAINNISKGIVKSYKQDVKDIVCKAKNPEIKDIKNIHWKDRDVKWAYHFIVGSGIINLLYKSNFYKYYIDGYKITNDNFDINKRAIKCKNGYILVKKFFSIKHLVKNLLQRI